MTLIEQITRDSIDARKAKDSVKGTFLTTLLSECLKIGKDDGNRMTTDQEVVAVLKKWIKNNDETFNAVQSRNLDTTSITQEKTWIETYLPTQATKLWQVRWLRNY